MKNKLRKCFDAETSNNVIFKTFLKVYNYIEQLTTALFFGKQFIFIVLG